MTDTKEALQLKKTIDLANEFVRRAKLVQKELGVEKHYFYGGKNNAAMKRVSMDLTRALAVIRRPVCEWGDKK